MYRGRTSIGEVLNLPNRVLMAMTDIRTEALMSQEAQQAEAGQLMEEEMQGG